MGYDDSYPVGGDVLIKLFTHLIDIHKLGEHAARMLGNQKIPVADIIPVH